MAMAGKGWGGCYPMVFGGPPMAVSAAHGASANEADGDHVAQLKDIQRNDPDGKAQWEAYTDRHGQSVRDPNKHEAEFVWTFITSYRSGVRYEPTHNLAELFKEGQRRSPAWKACWASYCSQNANGVNDPTKHDNVFLHGFLTFLGNAGERMLINSGGAIDAPPSKRMNVGSGVAVTTTTGSKSKDQLVQTIKVLQRQNEGVKEIWGTYCDTHFGGMRDPARQDASALETFLQLHGFAVSYGETGKPVVSTGDAVKDTLVSKIKTFQRQGESQKETWGSYADEHLGGRRDPARHDCSVLQNFVNLYGL